MGILAAKVRKPLKSEKENQPKEVPTEVIAVVEKPADTPVPVPVTESRKSSAKQRKPATPKVASAQAKSRTATIPQVPFIVLFGKSFQTDF